MFEEFIETWYMSAFPIVIYSIIFWVSAAKIKRVFRETGRAIRFDRDLQLVREAINFNMMWAVVAGVFYLLYFFAMVYQMATGDMEPFVAGIHFCALALVTSIGGSYSKKLEAELKNLHVESADPQMRVTYDRWISQWGKARLRLSDER